MYEMDENRFWKDYSEKDYIDIFYIKTKLWRGALKSAPISARLQAMNKRNLFTNNKNMIYINFPFCISRCNYCLYYSKKYDSVLVDEYLKALKSEVKALCYTEYIKTTKFECAYFGGGTPSLLEKNQIDMLASMLYESFDFAEDHDITFEVNPSSINNGKLEALKRNGFNRVSIGVQTFNDKYLKQMNCKHNSEEADEIIKLFLDNGFVINIDMIFGFEGQTEQELIKDLKRIVKYKSIHHISAYPLRLVTQTPLYNELEKRNLLDFEKHNNKLSNYIKLIKQFLQENGYIGEEELVHFYKKGYHPHRYLDGRIIGFGSGAGTSLNNIESGNIFDVNSYINAVNSGNQPVSADSILTNEQTYERFIFHRILYTDRFLPNFKSIISRRFKEFYEIDIGNRYEKVTDSMLKKKFIKIEAGHIEFTNRFKNILKKTISFGDQVLLLT